jgi:tetratricopeptide (TPR) repeat protein
MKSLTLSVLLAAGAALASAGYAQEAPSAPPAYVPTTPFTAQSDSGPPHWGGDPWRGEPSQAMPRSFEAGVAALEANDFVKAEAIFNETLRYYGSNPRFRFFMGVTKMNLGKWEEARRYLRTPARELRRLPDPKSYLGVTYVKLGDFDAAHAQRASLVKMAEACKGTCELSPYIASGIQMIDEALAESSPRAPSAQG